LNASLPGSCQLPVQLIIALISSTQMNKRAEEIAPGLPPDLDALPRLGGFRLRGIAMTRLETFIDAAFAFAMTMLVIAASKFPTISKRSWLLLKMYLRFWRASLYWEFFGAGIGYGAGITAWRMACRSSLAGR